MKIGDAETIAETILWMAKARFEEAPDQDLVRCIYTVDMEVSTCLMRMMKSIRKEERRQGKMKVS